MWRLIVVTYLFTLGLYLVNILAYPGYLNAKLGIELNYLLLIHAVSLVLLYCKGENWKDSKFFSLFRQANSKIILPGSLILSLFLALSEELNYQNYVLEVYKLHYIDFGLIFFLAYLTNVLTKTSLSHPRVYPQEIAKFSLVLIYVFGILATGTRDLHVILSREDGVIETLQFLLFFLSGGIALAIARKLRLYLRGWSLIYLALAGGLFFVGIEEISWGQRYLNIETPQYWEKHNVQRELNIHNFPFFHSVHTLIYAVIGGYGSFGWVLGRFFKSHIKLLFIPPVFLAGYFLPTLIYNSYYVAQIGTYHAWSEFSELCLAVGISVFLGLNYRIVAPTKSIRGKRILTSLQNFSERRAE